MTLTCIKVLSGDRSDIVDLTDVRVIMIPFLKYKTQLTKRLAELDGRLDAIETELDSHHTRDWEEMAVERENDEVLEELGNSGLHEIRQIHAALARLEDGTFGVCTICHGPIRESRLDVLPYTPFCSGCAV